MRYVIFWATIGMLLAARVAYYDEIRPVHGSGPGLGLAAQAEPAAPFRTATGR